jgi:hypothetical protein
VGYIEAQSVKVVPKQPDQTTSTSIPSDTPETAVVPGARPAHSWPASTPLTVGIGAATKQVATQSHQVAVYVFAAPNEGGFVDEAFEERRDAATDIRKALANKTELVVLVEAREQARVVVEVMSQGIQAAGQTETTTRRDPLFGGVKSTSAPSTVYAVRAKLTADAYEAELVGTTAMLLRDAAKDIAKQVSRW